MSTHSEESTTGSPATTGPSETYAVPTDEDALVCEYCGAPFADERVRALHWGLEHDAALTDEQRTAYADAREEEAQDLRLFRLKALGILVLLYFGLMMAYAVFA